MRNQAAKSEITQNLFSLTDLMRLCLGDKIGEGQYRVVFDFDLIPDTVIKWDKNGVPSCNWNEYNVYNAMKDTKFKKWFAPIVGISPGGEFLLMKKARPITDSDKLPKRLPNFFTDIKRQNFGYIGDQLVCVDYQFIFRALDISFQSYRECPKHFWSDE